MEKLRSEEMPLPTMGVPAWLLGGLWAALPRLAEAASLLSYCSTMAMVLLRMGVQAGVAVPTPLPFWSCPGACPCSEKASMGAAESGVRFANADLTDERWRAAIPVVGVIPIVNRPSLGAGCPRGGSPRGVRRPEDGVWYLGALASAAAPFDTGRPS